MATGFVIWSQASRAQAPASFISIGTVDPSWRLAGFRKGRQRPSLASHLPFIFAGNAAIWPPLLRLLDNRFSIPEPVIRAQVPTYGQPGKTETADRLKDLSMVSDLELPGGAPVPASGIYELLNVLGAFTSTRTVWTEGEPLPPTPMANPGGAPRPLRGSDI